MNFPQLLNFRKNTLRKSVSLFFAGAMVFANTSNAQIMYTDINPDLAGATWTQNVAGTTFENWGTGFRSVSAGAPEARCLVGNGDDMKVLNAGDMIAPTGNWNSDAWINGAAITHTDKYIGFRAGTTGNFKYGWFKISVTYSTTGVGGSTWTIKSYAYQNTPNTAIAAGDMGGGAANVPVTGVTVNSPAATITTAGGTLQMTTTVVPANATNPAVTWSVANGTGTGTISATGLLTAQTNGTVTVTATAQDGSNKSGTKVITISGQTTGIADINLLASTFYPNPVSENLTLQFRQEEMISNISITNIVGQVVYKVKSKKGTQITIPTRTLPQGSYMLNFENAAGKRGVQRFIKL